MLSQDHCGNIPLSQDLSHKLNQLTSNPFHHQLQKLTKGAKLRKAHASHAYMYTLHASRKELIELVKE